MDHFSSSLFVLAQAAGETAPQAEEPSLFSPWLIGLAVVVLLGLPFLLGTLIAGMLKMKDLSQRISVVLLVLLLGMAPFVSQYVIGSLEQRQYNRELAEWTEKQEAREKITRDGIAGLKEKIPGLNVQFDQQKKDPGEQPKISEDD